ncbi:MAG TPA: hypothetical protein VL461_02170 [Dictyobacter sp.]|jgi:hypothetical protein|nr:hypothetical protein [Dictyobacter sp.]
MDFEDNFSDETTEIGSDELLSDDNLRLPDGASPLVRLHAIRAWLARRQREVKIEMGETALSMQEFQEHDRLEPQMRRREREALANRIQTLQQHMQKTQEQLEAYQEAEVRLEDCVDHTTVGERLLVEYYLDLDAIIQDDFQQHDHTITPRVEALVDVQQRIEHVGTSHEED